MFVDENADNGSLSIDFCQVFPQYENEDYTKTFGSNKCVTYQDAIEKEDYYLDFYFDSAWCPPIAFYDMLLLKFPSISITSIYYESGCGFAGKYTNGIDIATEDGSSELYKEAKNLLDHHEEDIIEFSNVNF
jgi:hypothetical protein